MLQVGEVAPENQQRSQSERPHPGAGDSPPCFTMFETPRKSSWRNTVPHSLFVETVGFSHQILWASLQKHLSSCSSSVPKPKRGRAPPERTRTDRKITAHAFKFQQTNTAWVCLKGGPWGTWLGTWRTVLRVYAKKSYQEIIPGSQRAKKTPLPTSQLGPKQP